MICKTCGHKFHYCSSCDYDVYMSEGCCSEECFNKSDEYISWKKKVEGFWSSLNENQKVELWSMWDNGILYEGSYEKLVDETFIPPE